MSVSGLTGTPSTFYSTRPTNTQGAIRRRSLPLSSFRKCIAIFELPHLGRANFTQILFGVSRQRCEIRHKDLPTRAMSASYGDTTHDSSGSAIFPRINVRDPYRRLGISREASEDEIQAARNFLIQQYAGHKPSVDAIESAHDKIIMQKFYERRYPKIDIRTKVREVRQSKVIQFAFERFQTPSIKFIIKTAITFAILGVLTVLFPTEEGPTLQVALSLIATLYFIHDRLKSKLWAFLYGTGAFVCSWLFGTFLMVSVIPPFIKGARGFEVMSSLVSYVLLWVASTYLR